MIRAADRIWTLARKDGFSEADLYDLHRLLIEGDGPSIDNLLAFTADYDEDLFLEIWNLIWFLYEVWENDIWLRGVTNYGSNSTL